MQISKEQFRRAFDALPYRIRRYISSDEPTDIVEAIGNKYGLHIDVIGALDREVTNMLMGITNPQQFVDELKSVGVPAGKAGEIVRELNDMIFIPLQRKMREEGPDDPDEENSAIFEELAKEMDVARAPIVNTAPPAPPVTTPQVAAAPVTFAPSMQSASPVTPPTAAPTMRIKPFVPPTGTPPFPPAIPVAAQTAVAPVAPAYTPPAFVPPPAPPAPITQFTPQQDAQEYIRTMNSDVQAAQQHQAPTMRPFVPPAPPAPQVYTPPTPPATPEPTLRPRVMLTPSTPPTFGGTDSRSELRKIIKEYPNDPYREPIDPNS